jgi:signal transduction histidine kinase
MSMHSNARVWFLLRQILMELIKNGFKFNRARVKRVEVGWKKAADNRIEIFVRDNGIGIAPLYHEQIFHIFKRLHTDREFKGTGIGLAIVKRAVQKIGGSLWVDSQPGEGSTFYFNLPGSILDERLS